MSTAKQEGERDCRVCARGSSLDKPENLGRLKRKMLEGAMVTHKLKHSRYERGMVGMWYEDSMRFKGECFKVRGRENDREVSKRSKGPNYCIPMP